MRSTWFSLALAQLATACILPGEMDVHGVSQYSKRQGGNTGFAIGSGDRFADGTVPRGLGSLPADTMMESILNVGEVESAFYALAKEYGFHTFETPYKTYENRTIFGGAISSMGGNCTDKYRVYFNGNIHARERGSADNIIYFIADLLYANKNNVGLTWGGRSYTNCDVKRAMQAGIVFTPLSNPDGVAWDQSTHSCWRKNRNQASATPGNPNSIGIDLNRNFDFLWDYRRQFEPNVATNVASDIPTAQTFHGTAPFSEPETQSVKWVMDTYSKIRWYIDLHSVLGSVLYSWGSDENQVRRPYENFMNSSYDAVRGLMPDKPGVKYAEYIPSDDWRDAVYAGTRTGTAMDAATGRHYEVQQAAYLYPTSGASDDYAYSRHFANSSLNKIHAYCIEFGWQNSEASCPFYPTEKMYHQNVMETSAGFMEFLLAASDIGLGDGWRQRRPNICGTPQ